jgi:hypothetical protein
MPKIGARETDVAIRAAITEGIGKAESYGITDRKCVTDYIYLMYSKSGPRFDEDVKINEILRSDETEAGKMRLIGEMLGRETKQRSLIQAILEGVSKCLR